MPDKVDATTKHCTKCGEVKDLESGFSRNASSKDGRQHNCKDCNQEYRKANKEKRRAYYLENRETFLAKRAAYRAKNLDRIEAYKAANQDKIRATAAAYRASNKEKIREYNARESAVKSRERWRRANYKQVAQRREQLNKANPNQRKANSAVSYAIKTGQLFPQPCEVCGLKPKIVKGRQRIEAHHHKGYEPEHWLDVQWLCRRDHIEADAELRRVQAWQG